jgi:hypothetical protein
VRRAGVAGLAVLAAVTSLFLAAPALARSHRITGVIADIPSGGHVHRAAIGRMAALDYQGGPVLHWNRTHLVFWSPSQSGLSFDPGYMTLTEQFLVAVAADSHMPTNVYGLSGQYSDSAGPAAYDSRFGGAVTVTDPLPASQCSEPSTGPTGWNSCLTDGQLQQELEHVVSADRLPRTANDVYFLVLPNGLGSCIDASSDSCALGGSTSGYCGYHSETQDGLIYAVIPYNAVPGHCQSANPRPNRSTADPALSTISHEQSEVITDPETYNSWIDPYGNENGDLCITAFGPALGGSGVAAYNQVIDGHHYWLQDEWSNEDRGCRARDETDPVTFAVPSRITAGRRLTLAARASDPDGRIAAEAWNFGDGASASRRVVGHTFGRAGSYRIVLRVTDSAGNWAFSARTVRVFAAAAREPRHAVHHARRR